MTARHWCAWGTSRRRMTASIAGACSSAWPGWVRDWSGAWRAGWRPRESSASNRNRPASPKSGTGDGGLGIIGKDQLDWLDKDVAGLKDSTAIVVFAHVPLWAVYEKWGWGTRDAEQALKTLKRFGSLTVLNGHIHQVMQ